METWIEGAFDRLNQDVSLLSNETTVPAPAERLASGESVYVEKPCASVTKCYTTVLG